MNYIKENTNDLISICIVTQNNYNFMEKLLNSIFTLYQDSKIEIVIVDNNSKDNTSQLIEDFKNKGRIPIIYIKRKREFSLPENRNLAIKNSNGDIIVMIDSDIEFVDKKFFNTIRKIFQNNDVSMLAPLIIFSKTGLTQSLGLENIFKIPYLFKFKFPNMNPKRVEELTNDRLIEVQMIHGACFIFRKSLCEQIGCFDEFMEPYNFDEMDFTIRAYMHGFKIFATSKIYIMHYGGGTTNKFNIIQRAELFISHGFRSLMRNYKSKIFSLTLLSFIFFFAATYELLIESKKPLISIQTTIKSFIWAINNKEKPLIKLANES
jgi:GT2 family glycosyltransferase